MAPNTNDVVKTLRSLLNSTQNGLLEKQLWRDFREMEGYPVPFRELGYRTFVDFLKASEQFELINTQEGVHIRARLTIDSIHITELVSSQNRAKRKKSAKPAPFVPRRNIRLDTNWNHTAYSPVQSKPQLRTQSQQHQARADFQSQPRTQPQYQSRMASQSQTRGPSSAQQRVPSPPQQRDPSPPQQRVPSPPRQQFQAPRFESQYQSRAQPRNLSQEQNIQRQPTANMGPPVNTFRSNVPPATVTELVDLTESNVPTMSTPAKPVSSDDEWLHDRYDPTNSPPPVRNRQFSSLARGSQQVSEPKPAPAPIVERIKPAANVQNVMSQRNLNVAPKNEPKVNTEEVSPLWFNRTGFAKYETKSVFERLGSKPEEPATKPRPIQSRLDVKPTVVPAELPKATQLDTVDFVETKQKPIQPTIDHVAISNKISNEFLANLDTTNPKAALAMYCKQNGYDPPIFTTQLTPYKKYEGLVKVDGMTYSTLPFDHAKVSDAEDAAARLALSNIKDCPVSRESSDEIAQKIFDCIADNGIFLKYLPEIFKQKYETSLPDGYENIIQTRPEMFTVDTQPTHCSIIYKRTPIKQEHPASDLLIMIEDTAEVPRQNEKSKAEANEITVLANELKPMTLPWNETLWTVNVSWVVSTVDVWGHLTDSQCLAKLNIDLEDIEQKASRGCYPRRCQNVIVGGIYLTLHETPSPITAYRIQVKEMDDDETKALCFYIDDGYEEWIPLKDVSEGDSKIYQISRELCKYPPQAVHFSLFNVEDFAGNTRANVEAVKCLSDLQLLAKVKITKEDYEAQQEANLNAAVRVIFYDTSTEVDVNVNKKILENVCATFQPPQLERNASTVVRVKSISETGDIYCRLHKSKEMHHIKQLIDRLTCHGIKDEYRVDANDLTDLKALRLVYDETDKRWYRAVILPSKIPRKSALCKFVDYGHISHVEYENIYKLERLSTALSKYPPQTIVVRLNGFSASELTTKIIERLRELLCYKKNVSAVFIQSIDRSEIPMVNVWKRIGSVLCKINDSIRKEMEISAEMVSLPDSDDSFSSDEEDETTDFPLHPKPNCNQIYKAEVISALNPLQFYVRLTVDKQKYESMMHTLWKECENANTTLSKKDIKPKHFYAGRSGDGYWHRVKVQAVLEDQLVVVVQKWDSGDIDHLSFDALQPLPLSYHKIPQMVFQARLHDIQPRQKVWNKDDCAYFNELAVGKTFMAEIKSIQNIASSSGSSQNYVVELALISTENVNISEVFVEQRRAKYE